MFLCVHSISNRIQMQLYHRQHMLDLKCRGGNPPQFSFQQDKEGGGETQPNENCVKKRRVRNSQKHLARMKSDVMSATSPLAIEGVKDGDGKANQAGSLIKIEQGNGGKEKGTAPVAHTTAPAHLACQATNACCKCGPTST